MQVNFVPMPDDCEKHLGIGELYHVMSDGIIQTLQAKLSPLGRVVFFVPGDVYEQEGYWFVNEFEMIEDLWG